jgi:hypothetical protein
LIRDRRSIDIKTPSDRIAFSDVSQQIMAQTVAIEGLDVLEQNYDFDLLSPQALIEKNVGNTVRIARRASDSGETLEWEKGTILANNSGVILKMEDGRLEILNDNHNYHMVFDEVPADLRSSPTLTLTLASPVSGAQTIDMTYLSNGLSWQSDYVLQLDQAETSASLDSWITLNNQSGISFRDANLQLLAGDVNMAAPQPRTMVMMEKMYATATADQAVAQEALHGYHLYTVPFKTTIRNRQNKQIKLFHADSIGIRKRLVDRASINQRTHNREKSKPQQILVFDNREPALGRPLPRGTVRVYGRDSEGRNQFLGEDSIDHTAVNDELEVELGRAFDISIERHTTAHKQISKKQQRVTRLIKINNGGETAQKLELYEIMPTSDWRVVDSSSPARQSTPNEARFDLELAPRQKLELSYTVELNYR